ncbi:sulfatase [Telluribacter sp.]|uniref:sulfatase family protein n=1 Tax=Telluribacter sp. TaxID=1978767 RepID=UPI002E14A6B6|nr:sulfatase [Telluribacter sp.]
MSMTRYLIASVLLLLASTGFYLSQKPAPATKPNIIFLLTDDHRWDALGCMGNKLIKTPHLDKLAKGGALFKNAYVTTSICCVSRASMLSGQYMSRHGIEDFNTSFKPAALSQTYPMLLKQAGYHIGFVGKYGVGVPKKQPAQLFDFWAGSDKGQPDYEMKDEQGNYLHHTDKINGDIVRFLGTTDSKKPFCLSVSFKAPHVQDNDPRQFIIQPRYKPMYAGDSIAEPLTAAPKYWQSFPDFFRTEQNIARERWHLRFENNRMYQESVRNYYRLLSGVDEVVGNLVAALEEKGLARNTIIIFTGDNGFYLGEHGLAGKWYGHEESIRVPLIVYDPRNPQLRNKTVEQIALNIDVAPTILGMAGVEVPKTMQGVDLVELVTSKGKKGNREEFYYEHTFMGSPKIPKVGGIVSKTLKYMNFYEHDYEELYDLKKDPQETTNLATDSARRTQLNAVRKKYNNWKQAVL